MCLITDPKSSRVRRFYCQWPRNFWGGLPEAVSGKMTVEWGHNCSQLDIVGPGTEVTLYPTGCRLMLDTGEGVRIENLQISELALQLHSHNNVPMVEMQFLDVLKLLNK